ncbi:GAF and ANTAR domain-containing protein [Actinophytocola gossypii]|uniref:GAF and ANTAR domain-containing protein n=1 Tax=Actinophytocola gossypii TaxID=2812003 RepID=A0ABT2J972_9PSEU|nr:GAF and ANTAR domain-containing protein [Actinophytocola gossypii]MCT2584261.1 GAF and ANTAR domain-containing protein [Actinophytocola gossypii]
MADDLSTALADMARDLLAQPTLQATLDRIVAHAVDLVDGCESAGILIVRRGETQSLAATDDLARESDMLQGEVGEGPCLDATLRAEQIFRIPDVANDKRWPKYGPRAVDLGIHSALGFLLFTEDENLGALNMYARRTHAFPEDTGHAGWLLASHAAVAFANARTDDQLRAAVATRQEIGEAVGILMERYKMPEERAFDLLRRESQNRNIKLRDVARTVTETGEVGG